jgi:ABC-type multidrug transport system ATPase subunit
VEVMEDLGLTHIQDSRIGSVGDRGISGGERKRVSIASELLVDPSIIFLDEVLFYYY